MAARVTLSEAATGDGVNLDQITLVGSAFDVLGDSADGEVVLFEGLHLRGVAQHNGEIYLDFADREDGDIVPSRYLLPVDSDITLRYC